MIFQGYVHVVVLYVVEHNRGDVGEQSVQKGLKYHGCGRGEEDVVEEE